VPAKWSSSATATHADKRRFTARVLLAEIDSSNSVYAGDIIKELHSVEMASEETA
jgi:hypothetical protein